MLAFSFVGDGKIELQMLDEFRRVWIHSSVCLFHENLAELLKLFVAPAT
jgi:hypothetical protein